MCSLLSAVAVSVLAWRDQEPLLLQTPHFIIGTQRTPRAPALENFINQGPAMTSLWDAHRPGYIPTSCNTHCFLHARIERTDHRQRHSGSGLDVRMSQCNAMQCTAGRRRAMVETNHERGGKRRKTAANENRICDPTATVVVLSAPESRQHLATAVSNANFSGADAQTMRLRIRSMP